MLHHQERLSTGLLNSLQHQQVCDKCAEGLNSVYVHREQIVHAAMVASKTKCAMFSTTHWGVNQHCMENMS
jgi:hypothetical protein